MTGTRTDGRSPNGDPLLGREPTLPRLRDRHVADGDPQAAGVADSADVPAAGTGPVAPSADADHGGNVDHVDRTDQGSQADVPITTRRVLDPDPAIPDEILRQDAEERADRDPTPVDELRRASRSAVRRVLQVGMLLFIVLVGYYFVSLWQVWATGRSDQARSVDAIVVMGAAQYDGRPSPQLAARLDHVVELWPEGYAPIVVVTGGNQPGDRFTEAEASAQYLIDRGVPESAIVLEDEGSTSYDSLERVADVLADRSGDGASVLVVTDPYHSLRSRLIAQDVGLTAYVSPTDTSVVTGANSLERHIWEAGGVAIGRITGFEWLSDITN